MSDWPLPVVILAWVAVVSCGLPILAIVCVAVVSVIGSLADALGDWKTRRAAAKTKRASGVFK